MTDAEFATPRRELVGTLSRAAGGAGNFGVLEVLVPPGQRLLLRAFESNEPVRVIVTSESQITAGTTAQLMSVFNPPGVAALGLNGLRADVGLLGMVINDQDDLHTGLDMVIDFNQRLTFICQTENAAFAVSAHFKMLLTSDITDQRMST